MSSKGNFYTEMVARKRTFSSWVKHWTQQEIADRAKITLRQYQRLESGERSILTCSFGLACRVIEALNMDVSKFYHGDYYLEEVKTMRGKGIASRKKSSI